MIVVSKTLQTILLVLTLVGGSSVYVFGQEDQLESSLAVVNVPKKKPLRKTIGQEEDRARVQSLEPVMTLPAKVLRKAPLDVNCSDLEEELLCGDILNNNKGVPQFREKRTTGQSRPISILDIQPYSHTQFLRLNESPGQVGEVRLVNLNVNINSWYLLKVVWPNRKTSEWFHLEAIRPETQKIILDPSFRNGLIVKEGSITFRCDLWAGTGAEIKIDKLKQKPFTLICGDRLYLRQRIEGYRTTKEWVVEFLRDNIWAGEAITNLFKSTLYKDRYLIDAKSTKTGGYAQQEEGTPKSADLSKKFEDQAVEVNELGIILRKPEADGTLRLGDWYASREQAHAFVSVLEARAIHEDVLNSHKSYVKPLGKIESTAMNYLVAFDLEHYDLNFSVGTEHPRVGWSARVRDTSRDLGFPGPDGFKTIEPIAPTGLIPPHLSKHIIATFTGGFKRSHGAFKWGNLSLKNSGSHYGFLEQGVIFSRLQPELATVLIDIDGRVRLKTWQEEDSDELHRIRHARQNGVPVIEFDQEQLRGVPGRWVSNWTKGNWSGSQDREFRTLRAGLCLSQQNGKNFLIYGYFSSVTPTAMARIFQAYHCDYALHLDMNALEHTYMALYPAKRKNNVPQQLIKGMKVLDQRFKGNVPRFIGYPDNRDYFYLTPKEL